MVHRATEHKILPVDSFHQNGIIYKDQQDISLGLPWNFIDTLVNFFRSVQSLYKKSFAITHMSYKRKVLKNREKDQVKYYDFEIVEEKGKMLKRRGDCRAK